MTTTYNIIITSTTSYSIDNSSYPFTLPFTISVDLVGSVLIDGTSTSLIYDTNNIFKIKNMSGQQISAIVFDLGNQQIQNLATLIYTNGNITFENPPISPPSVPTKICFTFYTLQKITPLIANNNYKIIQSIRDKNIKIIRAEHKDLGMLEFTENHPFIYNNKIIQFKNLVLLNPNFKNIMELTNPFKYVYNFVSNENVFKLTDDLHMIGAQHTNTGYTCDLYRNNMLSHSLNNVKLNLIK